MITADQIVAHLVGDYVLQSDWMANTKTKSWWPAFCHALVYSLCFLPLFWTSEASSENRAYAMIFIFVTHFAIDRWRLARYVVWAKNFLAPQVTGETRWWHPWEECKGTGYHKDRPPWLAVWLLIIADNTMHLLCNGFALWWAG